MIHLSLFIDSFKKMAHYTVRDRGEMEINRCVYSVTVLELDASATLLISLSLQSFVELQQLHCHNVFSVSAAVIALFCRQYDIIKDNDSSNSKEKVKPSSERSTPEHHSGGLLRSKVGHLWTFFSTSISLF